MSSRKEFISARWLNLVLISYKVPCEILKPFLPNGLELDTINSDAFASLVAFDFLDTRVKGFKIPFHINFPEINLRFYVRDKERRGVVFIREIVPKRIIALVANTFFNENYTALTMKSRVNIADSISIFHEIIHDDEKYSIRVLAENKPYLPGKNSTEHFFKEHEWGFVKNKNGLTQVYRVEHPIWDVYPFKSFEHNFDFGIIYGSQFAFLNEAEPFNVTVAKGSAVKVFGGELL